MSDTTLFVPQPAPATMKIASEDTEAGYIIINAADFDPATMTPYGAGKRSRAAATE